MRRFLHSPLLTLSAFLVRSFYLLVTPDENSGKPCSQFALPLVHPFLVSPVDTSLIPHPYSSLQILVPPIRGVRRGSDEETEGKDENRHLNELGILTSGLLISSSVNEI